MTGVQWTDDSAFPDGDQLQVGDIVVGLRSAGNYKFDFPSTGIKDADGNFLIKWGSAGASSTDYIEFTNGLTGTDPSIDLLGSSTNIGLDINLKGSGVLTLNSTTGIDSVLDEDTMASNSATAVATQQSIVAYIASVVSTIAGGSNTQIQYNNSGALGGDSGFTTDGAGSLTVTGDISIDNININGNSIISSDVNGDINLSPNGTGTVVINTDLDVDNLNFNGNTIISTDTDGDITLTPNGDGSINLNASVTQNYTATFEGDHGYDYVFDATSFEGTSAFSIAYAAATAAGENSDVIGFEINDSGSTGGNLSGIRVDSVSGGSGIIWGLSVGLGVNPLRQSVGTFGNADTVLVNAVDQTVALSSGGAGNVSVFVANSDTITIGLSTTFDEIEIIVDTPASNPGVRPTFEYSTGVGTWASFVPIDNTNGFRQSGEISWVTSDLAGWAVGTGAEFLIRITRTRPILSTTPILDLVLVDGTTIYKWDSTGAIEALSGFFGSYVAVGVADENTVTVNGSSFSFDFGADTNSSGNRYNYEASRHTDTANLGSGSLYIRSRGTHGAETIVQNGDLIGSVFFAGYDGVDYALAGRIDTYVNGTPGSNDMPGEMRFSLSADGTQSPSEIMSLDENGMQLGASNARVTTVLDEDNMVSDSATALATQQSIKAYVDTSIASAAGGSNTQIQYNSSGALAGDTGFTTDGAGSLTVVGDISIDNININGNSIISSDVNGDINLSPNGTGTVVINTDLDVDNVNINGNTVSSTDVDGNIVLDPNGTGEIQLGAATVTVEQYIQHSGDADNFIEFGTDTQDFQTGSSSRMDISDSGVRFGAANARITTVLDQDDMSSDSATALATQQSIKAYVDATVNTASRQNLLVNGQFQVIQEGNTFTAATTPANNDDTYLIDQWILLSDGNDIVDVSQETSLVPTGSYSAIKLEIATANKKAGIFQPLVTNDSFQIIGGTASLSFKARIGGSNATVDNIRAAVVSWSSTADTITSDIVSAWNVEDTDPTLVANWTYENTPSNLTLTSSYQTFEITNISIDTASTANVGVFIWINNGDGTAADTVYITDVQLNPGAIASSFEARPYSLEEELCQRFYWRSGLSSNYPAIQGYGLTGQVLVEEIEFPIKMRTPPSISTSGTWSYSNASGMSVYSASEQGMSYYITITADGIGYAYSNNSAYFAADARL